MLTDTVSKICVTVLIVGVLATTVVLAWHGTLDGGQVLGIITAVMGLPALLFVGNKLANSNSVTTIHNAPTSNGPPQT